MAQIIFGGTSSPALMVEKLEANSLCTGLAGRYRQFAQLGNCVKSLFLVNSWPWVSSSVFWDRICRDKSNSCDILGCNHRFSIPWLLHRYHQ